MGLPLPSGQLREGLWVIRDAFVNLFVLAGKGGLVCVDAGWRPRAVRREFRTLGLDPADVKAVLLTHSDRDHSGGLSVFPNATILAGFGEADLMRGRASRWMKVFYNPPSERPVQWVGDGEVVNAAGIRLRVVATPGHTPGSLSFVLADRVLFVGDAMWRCGGARILPFFNMEAAQAKDSLRRLLESSGGCVVFSAHGGIVRGDFELLSGIFRGIDL